MSSPAHPAARTLMQLTCQQRRPGDPRSTHGLIDSCPRSGHAPSPALDSGACFVVPVPVTHRAVSRFAPASFGHSIRFSKRSSSDLPRDSARSPRLGRARAVTATLISRSSGSAVAGGGVLLAKSMTPRTLTVLRVAACLGEHDRIEELVV